MLLNLNSVCPDRRPGRRVGIAAVEFAVVAPLLISLFLGMTELSRGMMVKVALNNAARKGCRAGIMGNRGSTDILNDVIDVMRDNGFDSSRFNPPNPGSVVITVTDPSGKTLSDALDAPTGSIVSVQVTIPVSSTMWLTAIFLKQAQLESEVVVMMKQ